jgi:hypothetical protein
LQVLLAALLLRSQRRCRSIAALSLPTLDKHPQILQAKKRWWQCEGCKYRFATVGQKYPAKRCVK